MTAPTNVNDTFPRPFLHYDDLDRPGGYTLLISGVEVKQFAKNPRKPDGEKIYKPVLSFDFAKKKLICNATQARTIAKIAGSGDYSKWEGVKIIVMRGLSHNGKNTIAINSPAAPSTDGINGR